MVHLKTIGTLYNGDQELSFGTGFIISIDGVAITSSHVIPDRNLYKSVESKAVFADKTEKDFELLRRDETNDVAFIKVKGYVNKELLQFGDSDAIGPGEQLYVVGFPLNLPLTISPGILMTKETDGIWVTNAPINIGSSGGPAFESGGNVIAIAVEGIPKARIYQGHFKGQPQYTEIEVRNMNRLIPINTTKTQISQTLQSIPTEVAISSAAGQGYSIPFKIPAPSQSEFFRDFGHFGIVPVDPVVVLQERRIDDPLFGAKFSTRQSFVPPQEIRVSVPVNETYDQHPNILIESTQEYLVPFYAEVGYKIVNAEVIKLSDTGVGNEHIEMSPNGKSGHYTFTLRSGPAFDRYRGWLHGSIQTQQVFCGSTC